jgi:hypothetical protein
VRASVFASLSSSIGPRNKRNGKDRHEKERVPDKIISVSQMIDEMIRELGDWRAKMLAQLHALIKKEADPEVVGVWTW